MSMYNDDMAICQLVPGVVFCFQEGISAYATCYAPHFNWHKFHAENLHCEMPVY